MYTVIFSKSGRAAQAVKAMKIGQGMASSFSQT